MKEVFDEKMKRFLRILENEKHTEVVISSKTGGENKLECEKEIQEKEKRIKKY